MAEHLHAKIGQYALIFNEFGKMLIVERPRSRTWCLPGGRLEEHERDWEAALLREIKEETNLVCSNPVPTGIELEEDPYQVKYCVYFRVQCSNLNDFKLDPEEHSDYKWIGYEEAVDLNIESSELKKIILGQLRI